MPKDYSPFTPGLPVPLEFFVGRQGEVKELARMAGAATAGRLQVGFVAGERGIGKSSLAAFARALSERDHQVIGLHAFLGGVSTLEEMVRRVFDRLVKESVDKPWYEKVKGFLGSKISSVGLYGVSVEFAAGTQDLQRLVNDFVPVMRNLTEKLRNQKQGLLLILDDINGLAESIAFANWLKSVVDEIATGSRPVPLCILLVGLEERRDSLVRLQPSLARVLNIIEIKPWSEEETKDFFMRAFHSAGVEIEDAALRLIVSYTGGLPVLAHEIGEATFKADSDDRIDENDALRGIVNAAEIVGRKFLQPQVLKAIRSERYRTILQKMSRETHGLTIQRSELRKALTEHERGVLDNFLRRMESLGVVRRDDGAGRGAYQFTNRLHELYFALQAIVNRSKKGQA